MDVLQEMKVVFTYILEIRGQLRENGAFFQFRSAYVTAFLGTGFYFEG